jgi:6,7-dimethyl-8-ribityllumazine synthase
MVKSIHLGNYVLAPEDYRIVLDFFRAIGCDFFMNAKGFAGFMAPKGGLMIRELRPARGSAQTDNPRKRVDIEVSNPEVVRNVAESMGLKILPRENDESHFAVELPGDISVLVEASREEPTPVVEGTLGGEGKSFAVVVSRFNSFITERLLQGTIDGLTRSGVDKKNVQIVRVPGSFEIPSAARTLAETKKYDAIICLGCLLRGDTAHYDVIVNEVTRGIGQSAQETGVPHAFGVLTCDTLEQAIDRAGLKMGNKGFEAALAAMEMGNLKKAISHQSLCLTAQGRLRTALSKKQIPRFARNDKSERARSDQRDRPRSGSKKPAKASKTKRRK